MSRSMHAGRRGRPPGKSRPPDERFDALVVVREPGPVHTFHEWVGSADRDGYGRFSVGGRWIAAHRYSLARRLGRPLELGSLACHRCDEPLCVNPDCLFEGSIVENNDDKVAKASRIAELEALLARQGL